MARNNSTTPLATARRVRALELRLQGQTYREIGAVLGCNPATAYRATQKALRHPRRTRRGTAHAGAGAPGPPAGGALAQGHQRRHQGGGRCAAHHESAGADARHRRPGEDRYHGVDSGDRGEGRDGPGAGRPRCQGHLAGDGAVKGDGPATWPLLGDIGHAPPSGWPGRRGRVADACLPQADAGAGLRLGVLVDPFESNARTHRFYERLGFQFVERRQFGRDRCAVYRLDRSQWAT